jgi:uncharacterized protein (TIGR02246 family)
MRKIIIALSYFGLMLAASCPAFCQESPDEAIRRRVKEYEAAYNAGHADSVAAIYAVNGTHTFANGLTLHGRLEIANGLKEQFAGPFNGTRMAITPLQIRALSNEIAVEEASFTFSGLKDATGTELPAINGLCLVVYQKDGDQWYIAAAQCMIPPPPQPLGKE